jgi:hypothetical protein
MKKLAFRRRRNSRIRNLIVMGSSMILTVFIVSVLVLSEEITAIELSLYGMMYVLICVPIMLMPFGNMLESRDNGQIVSYYQIGPLKFDQYAHDSPTGFQIEKDEEENYSITMEFFKGRKFVIEKYPTRLMAEERLDDFKQLQA